MELSNNLHELELTQAVAASCDSPGIAKGPTGVKKQLTSNGISFDSDRFEFREFVDVACQTSPMEDKEKEALQDRAFAFEMQNKFLNKEVLELNHLRQQLQDREQKLFM